MENQQSTKTKTIRSLMIAAMTLGVGIFTGCQNSSDSNPTQNEQQSLVISDSLKQSLGADPYGMRQYVMAFLKEGPNRDQDSATAAELQRKHMENIKRMAESGKLVLAGPFLDNGDIRGIYVFKVSSMLEAKQLTESDPAIQAGRLEMELKPWYGSAALLLLTDLHNQLESKEISE
jgi:uncharacterized protein YciI